MESKVKNLKEIRTLIKYLNERTKEYDEGHPTISDLEWDKIYFTLKDLENEYSIYYNDSPTQTISYEIVNSLEKVTHNHEMLSLDKTKSLDEIKDFLKNSSYLAMCKMDGLTCSLKYENGILVSAETRGDGKIGENILHNVKVIPSIPTRIPLTETLIIDGEIICSKKDFVEFEKDYANPRNFAAGSIRLLDAKECFKRKLQFIAWDVIEGMEEVNDLSIKLNALKGICGFTIVPYIKSDNIDNIDSLIKQLTDLAEDLTYPIDGLVFKFNDIKYGKSLGKTAHHFKNAIAYKFADETEITKLINIDWTMGRTGQITPVAVFEPIELDGSTINRASLHNISIMEELLGTPYKGQRVWVSKKNMIIPQIEKAEKKEDNLI